MARKTQSLQLVQDATMERVAVSAVSKIGPLVPPWLLLGLEAGGAAFSHAMWGGPGSVAWAAIGCTLGSTVLTGLTWLVSHRRRMLGRVHSTATTAAAAGWFTVATITGVTADATVGTLFFGGVTLALSWNIRSVIRLSASDDALDGGGDALSNLFDRAKEQAGLKGARVRATEVTDHKIKGQMQLPPGEMTSEDAQKARDRVESAMQLPPGSVTVTQDQDRADRAHMSVSDPRAIRQAIPWPGPSHPGASIDKPLRIGVYQDGDPVEYRFVGHHLQIMGMTGSGKSIGGAWNIVGEIMTRKDTAVFSIDISKDDQTMGPLREGLHRFETTKAGAVALIRALHAEIPKRTKWLASRGFQNWEPGCGLAYWFFHVEEVAKLFNELDGKDGELLEEILKEFRSAGGSVIMSLQRADYTQIPTIVRSQMAKMCFGLNDPDDVKFGVSARQRKAEAAPHEWEDHYPGMALLDGKSVRPSHYAMPLRTYAWGDNSRQANALMSAHAAAYPAAAKVADEFTARLMRPHSADAAPAGTQGPAAAAAPHSGSQPLDAEAFDERAEFLAEHDELLADAAELVITAQHASAAMLARKLRIPAADATRLMEALERKDVIGPAGDDGKRPVLVTAADAAAVVERLRETGDPVTAALRTDDPDPSVTAGPADAVQDPTQAEAEGLETPEDDDAPMDPAAARGLVADWLRHRHATGNKPFTASDPELTVVRKKTGNGRTWTYNVLREMTALGVLQTSRSGGNKTWTIVDLSPLDGDRELVPA
ncbi:DNA translocase FtsK [Spirillospora sp. NPDC048832]